MRPTKGTAWYYQQSEEEIIAETERQGKGRYLRG